MEEEEEKAEGAGTGGGASGRGGAGPVTAGAEGAMGPLRAGIALSVLQLAAGTGRGGTGREGSRAEQSLWAWGSCVPLPGRARAEPREIPLAEVAVGRDGEGGGRPGGSRKAWLPWLGKALLRLLQCAVAFCPEP